MLKLKNILFIFIITLLFTGCAARNLFPTASNDLQTPDGNFYPTDTTTSHNFGPGY